MKQQKIKDENMYDSTQKNVTTLYFNIYLQDQNMQNDLRNRAPP